MCNPILQAKVVNDAETDFNVVMGLCVGHDSLFFKYAEAPSTVLSAKDRVLGHNPPWSNFYSWELLFKTQEKRILMEGSP